VLLWRSSVVIDGRAGSGFQINPETSLLGLQLVLITSFGQQFSFLAMLAARIRRTRLFEARRAARSFEIALDAAKERDRLSTEMEEQTFTLSLLTHEVRQPINNARAALEALDYEVKADSPNAAKAKQAIGRAQAVLDSITLSISNAILGASMLEDSPQIKSRPVNAGEVAELAKFDCPLDLSSRILLISDEADVYIDADPILLRLALRNLLDNALKYSDKDSTVDVFTTAESSEVLIAIVDRGIGIPSRDIERVFERFYRVDTARSREQGGTGLGLSLVKHISMSHRGEVTLFSQQGVGSTFTIRLPRLVDTSEENSHE
jgi:signal transduction histidine kinase